MASETPDELRLRVEEADQEIAELRHRLAEAPQRVRLLEERLLEVKGQLAHAVSQNEKLTFTLQQAKENIAALREEVDKLTQPPSAYGTFLARNDDETIDVFASGRKMRVALHPAIDPDSLQRGQEVVLNESLNVVLARSFEQSGEVVTIEEVLEDGHRALIVGRADEVRVAELSDALMGTKLRAGDSVLMDVRTQLLLEKLPRPEIEEVVLEEVPDITYADIGGLDGQIEAITDAVELPFLHRELFAEHQLPAPKGILLYGPPGCGKTLIAKAVANSLAKKVAERTGDANTRSYFLNVKGPELLNKYVGETERQIRLIFQRAREKSEEGMPVIVFFDEMDSLFRTRGTGISSDMESTIVPQLLAEIDGVETLRDVIVIGASNREDLIDPAILRPGRLDVKIKIERPDENSAQQIFARYLTADLPLDEDEVQRLGGGDREKTVQAMIEKTVGEMYRSDEENRFLEVTYQNGDKEILFFKDFASGAMIENIVRRAKKLAIKRTLAGETRGIRSNDLLESIKQEYKENEDLPNTTNPDDWAKISGKKGERIVYVRTVVNHGDAEVGGRAIERVGTGQYLLSAGAAAAITPVGQIASTSVANVAIPKVCGIETEYGILAPGSKDGNPTTAASLLINAYVADLGRVQWDFEDESPGRDARGFVRDGSMPPEIETHLVNTVLTNGARYYVDHAHPEYSTPECRTARELVVHDRAGEVILERSMAATRRWLEAGAEIVVHKNNSDGKGNSYGCHENYLLDRAVPFARLAREFTVHLVTRQIYTGAGKVGCEEQNHERPIFEISQRADFFEEEVGLETTLKRPIINTRDEPHADPERYRRLHVITGDANLAEVSTFLKVGVTALVLLLIEDEVLTERELVLARPVLAMHEISHDLTLRQPVELVSGETIRPIDLQWELFDIARKYADERGLAELGEDDEGSEILDRWEAVLGALETDPSSLHRTLDWVAKRELVEAYCARHQCGLEDHRVQALDLQYHDLRPARSLFRRIDMERLVTDEAVFAAVTDPPRSTRAFFRGECLKRFGPSITAANWDSIVFDLGEDPLRRVPMMEPLRGSAAHVDTLLSECKSPAELLERLGG